MTVIQLLTEQPGYATSGMHPFGIFPFLPVSSVPATSVGVLIKNAPLHNDGLNFQKIYTLCRIAFYPTVVKIKIVKIYGLSTLVVFWVANLWNNL